MNATTQEILILQASLHFTGADLAHGTKRRSVAVGHSGERYVPTSPVLTLKDEVSAINLHARAHVRRTRRCQDCVKVWAR